MNTSHPFEIACNSPEALEDRITKAPFRLITDLDELRELGYQDEGAIVPELEKCEPLTQAELAAMAVDVDTPDVLRLVRVPQRTGLFMQALGRSGLLFESEHGQITAAGMTILAQAMGSRVSTTINPTTGKYVGMHIDAMRRDEVADQNMMGIACSEGPRGLTFCPSITVDEVSKNLRFASSPEKRLVRREQIRQAAAKLQGEAVCYTVWLEGSSPTADTYEAYANFKPLKMLHDGTSYDAMQPAGVWLLNTMPVTSASFESIV